VCIFGQNIAPADAASKTVSGNHGESVTVSTTSPSSNGLVNVQGAHFDETVGIYLAYCVVPKHGKLPTPCGGGINKSGMSAVSFWISSNPPPYGKGLAEDFLPGGRFKHTIRVSPLIGKFDCRKVKCAITIRADHTRDSDRTYDIFIPITFPKKQ
jgi:hypothetical protein